MLYGVGFSRLYQSCKWRWGRQIMYGRSLMGTVGGGQGSVSQVASRLEIFLRKLVEAAGVEPASESTSSWDSTCVSASEFSCPA